MFHTANSIGLVFNIVALGAASTISNRKVKLFLIVLCIIGIVMNLTVVISDVFSPTNLKPS